VQWIQPPGKVGVGRALPVTQGPYLIVVVERRAHSQRFGREMDFAGFIGTQAQVRVREQKDG
jgi:hypothetical protein